MTTDAVGRSSSDSVTTTVAFGNAPPDRLDTGRVEGIGSDKGVSDAVIVGEGREVSLDSADSVPSIIVDSMSSRKSSRSSSPMTPTSEASEGVSASLGSIEGDVVNGTESDS